MAEEAKKPEEELKKTETEVGKGAEGAGEGAGAGADEETGLTPDQKLINELRERAETAEKSAAEANRERDEERQKKTHAQKEASTAFELKNQAQEDAIKSRVESAKTAFQKAQQEYEDSYDSGDKKKISAAQIALNDAQAQLRGAEYHEEQFAVWKESNKNRAPSTGNSRFTKPEQQWIEKNPQFNSDRRFRAAVYAADEEAKEKGITVDSQEYFRHLEDYVIEMGFEVHGRTKKVEDADEEDDLKKEEPKKEIKKSEKKQSSTAVPPGGSSGSTGGGKQKTFVMTPEMREAAAYNFPDLHKKDPKAAEEKYAKLQIEIQEKKAKGEL